MTKKSSPSAFSKTLPKNLFSGFVVSLIALPLGLGLALASGAPPISGILAAVVGGLLVSLLGGSHVTITGPGNGLVIVVLGAITTLGEGDPYQGYLYTLAAIVLSGVLLLLMGFLKMGRLSDFFPSSAIEGMLAAIGLGILSKQFHVMVGNMDAKGSVVELLAGIPAGVWESVHSGNEATLTAMAIGLISLLILVFYPKIRNPVFHLVPAPMWVLIISVSYAYLCNALGLANPLTADYLVAIPDNVFSTLAFPDFGKLAEKEFLIVVFTLTLIASIESLLSIKAVDKLDPENRRSNVNKDLKALGLGTIVSGLVGGLNVVTVIARSSVNVNNGATNRSANFFHAIFLLVMVLVFQSQLQMIPLAALAAILVYTGYRLATPDTFKKVAQIGKEQLFIFLATLFATLFTNLITGIGIGILVTFLIHVFVNRSLGLFIRNIFKPNILMFKEEDSGNYYISVKYFCSFLNFHKLENKLDAVPSAENVVLDFSQCNFVDDTTMESLENHANTFGRRGGSMELIGLDKHDADSRHPFALRKLLTMGALKPIESYLTKRQDGLQQIAKDYGWIYDPSKTYHPEGFRQFLFFRGREIRYSYNHLYGDANRIAVHDLEFTEGEFIAREVVKTSIMHIRMDHPLPVFTLDKEGILQLLYSVAGFQDIRIDGHPDFSKRFHLRGRDQESVRGLFTDELVLFLESHPYYHVESNGEALLILQKERLAGVRELRQMIYFGQELARFMKCEQFA